MTQTPSSPPPARRFLMVHGLERRRPRQHWLWWLTEALRQGRAAQALPVDLRVDRVLLASAR